MKNCGNQNILIAVVDVSRDFLEEIGVIYPQRQTCIVQIRNSLSLATWKDRKALATALKPIYQAANRNACAMALTFFTESDWSRKFIVPAKWQRQWE